MPTLDAEKQLERVLTDEPFLEFRLPTPALRPYISSYYGFWSGADAVDEILPPEWGNVRFYSAGWRVAPVGAAGYAPLSSAISGPTSRGVRFLAPTHSSMLGIGFLPAGWARLTATAASALADIQAPLEVHLPVLAEAEAELRRAEGLEARIRILDDLLMALIVPDVETRLFVETAHAALLDGDVRTVEAFAGCIGVSVRTLERLCGPAFGFGPKKLLRRQRFLRSLDALLRAPERPLGELVDHGYVDQSHFIKEFKDFMGVLPSEYMAMPRTVVVMAAIARTRATGHSLQLLHKP